ncbi:MAG: lipoprotein signal peptidase [Salinivirgaceae bacterium]|nr:lipoprotein signal peptidase [Salinivirgaceae bacterium]
MSKGKLAILLIALILISDQVIKIWVKTHMMIDEEIPIFGDWFNIHFNENNGIAFGKEFFGKVGKYILSIFRITAVGFISYYIWKLTQREIRMGYFVCVTLILAGAAGNSIDCAFYGMIFDHSWNNVAQFVPFGTGYSSFLQGRVVDMFYCPIIQGHWPAWSPIYATEKFIFFRPIFNVADSAITCGMIWLLLFERNTLQSELDLGSKKDDKK